MQDDLDVTDVGSVPTIFTRTPPAAKGGHLDQAAAAAADIVPEKQDIHQGTGPKLADGKTLVDGRISNNHVSPC